MATIEERKQKLEQQKARLQKEEAAIRKAERKLDTKQKIVWGGLSLNVVKSNPQIAALFLSEAERQVTRESDLKAIEPILKELRSSGATHSGFESPDEEPEELSDEEAAEMGLNV